MVIIICLIIIHTTRAFQAQLIPTPAAVEPASCLLQLSCLQTPSYVDIPLEEVFQTLVLKNLSCYAQNSYSCLLYNDTITAS